ncbi:MAG: transcriptional regulator [Verrucomicrobiales bacterium]|nr:transcriptional regulator [Verrucomicrobiales bacterium]
MILAPSPRPIPSDPKLQLEWLRNFLTEEIPEDSSLDYKHSDSLHKIFKKAPFNPAWLDQRCSGCGSKGVTADKVRHEAKNELTKDVSGFANNRGGLLIYGIAEDSKRKSVPKEFAPVASTINPEDIVQILNSTIKPPIDGVGVKVIVLEKADHPDGGCCVAIEVPKSSTAHQAKDKLYYRRRGTQTVAMENDEILDVMNRSRQPNLECEILLIPSPRLSARPAGAEEGGGLVYTHLHNSSPVFCKNFLRRIIFPFYVNDAAVEIEGVNGVALTEEGEGYQVDFEGVNLFPDIHRRRDFSFVLKDDGGFAQGGKMYHRLKNKMLVQIFADEMPKKEYWVTIDEAVERVRNAEKQLRHLFRGWEPS